MVISKADGHRGSLIVEVSWHLGQRWSLGRSVRQLDGSRLKYLNNHQFKPDIHHQHHLKTDDVKVQHSNNDTDLDYFKAFDGSGSITYSKLPLWDPFSVY